MNISSKHRRIIESPCCSFWLSKAYKEAIERDIVDALRDVELLKTMLDERYDTIKQGRAA